MVNYVGGFLIVTIVISSSQGRRVVRQDTDGFQELQVNQRVWPMIRSIMNLIFQQSYSNQGFNRLPNKLMKDLKNPPRDWLNDWDRLSSPSSPSNFREDEIFEESSKNSYEEEIQYDDPVTMFDADRMDTYPFPKSYDPSPDSSLYPALDGMKPESPRYDRMPPTMDKNGRRNSDSLRQRSFALSAFPSQIRQVRRTRE